MTKRYVTSKCYPSNNVGHYIVNAMTGEKYNYKVGSADSLRLYKVIDTSGYFNSSGYLNDMADRENVIDNDPNFLYYDNPSEYLQHRGYERDAAVSDRWREYQENLVGKNNKINMDVYHKSKNIRLDVLA